MKRLLLIASAFLFFCITPALAQIQDQTDYQRLQWRYDQLLKSKNPLAIDAIQKGINAERAVIRTEMEKEMKDYIKTQESAENSDLARSVDRERAIVATLAGWIDETKVDSSLLTREEEYYKDVIKTGTGAPPSGQIMLTKNYPELLGKKAVLEERLAVLQAYQKTQQDRLSQFKSEQEVRSFTTFMGFLAFLAILFAVFWGERIIRTVLLDHIPNRKLRYLVTKIFTFLVYIGLIFWLEQKITSDPSILTVLGLVGAALIFVTQDHIKGLIGWIGARNVIALGQRVTIDNVTGDVVDIGLLYTTLLVARTDDMEEIGHVGQLMRIPNEKLFGHSLVNWHSTSDFEHVEIPVVLAHMEQGERAFQILDTIVKHETLSSARLAREQNEQRMRGYAVSREPPSSRVYMELTDEGQVKLIVCFPAPIGHRRAVTTHIVKEALKKFAEEGIELAESDQDAKHA